MSSKSYIVIAALLISAGVARVAATYSTFRATYDEPWHVAIGMEWLQWHTYTYEIKHPPLARGAVALGPYLAGIRSLFHRDMTVDDQKLIYEDGNAIFEAGDKESRNLALARAGILPFLVLACIVTFLWAKRWFTPAAGLWALLLLVCTAPILGHAGVATMDMACAATVLLALYRFSRWMEDPGWKNAALLGASVAIAFLTKLSTVPFLGACFVVGLIVGRSGPQTRLRGRTWMSDLLIAGAVGFICMWAVYGFTLVPLEKAWGPHPRIDAMMEGRPWLASAWKPAASVPLPLTEFIVGIREVSRHNAIGHDSYLLGEYRDHGWWYFFLVVLAVKSPIGLLVLAAWRGLRPAQALMPLVFALVILTVCLFSSIDLGVRHILPIYPLLALAAGHLLAEKFHKRNAALVVSLALALWVVVDSVRAHPDYLAHFNELAPHPERILAESDLDWGQDLKRLSRRLKEKNVQEFSIAYFGSALLQTSGLPTYSFLDPRRPSSGWIAISLHHLYLTHAKDGSYDWLKKYTPVERIGKSIDLFYIE